jgi:hypothetical protein
LTVTTPAGPVRHEAAVIVTPIAVAPTGESLGRGTYASPKRLCAIDPSEGPTLASGDISI